MAEPMVPFGTTHAKNGMVCSIDHHASSAGVAMLRAGGSAADAAVATNAVLAITSQHMCGMGGDLFALVHHRNGPPEVLNASGRAGSGADPEALRAAGHTTIPFRMDINSVPIPGCVDGWLTLHERHGRLPLADVLAPAISYADGGFPASITLSMSAPSIRDLPGADDYRTTEIRPGTILRRPRVADALRAIVEGGRDAWYLGDFGTDLLELGAHGGAGPDGRPLYTREDLERPQADWVEPLGVRALGHDLWTIPPNSQGYLTLAGSWIADGLDLPDDPDDPLWAHLLIESARQAAYDRYDVLHEGADGAALLDPTRLGPRRSAIDPDRAAALGDAFRDGDTTYLVAVDGDRMGVSLIQSNASGFGCGLVAPRVGVFLQNRGYGFSLVPGHPAEYGPGKRPPHTLSPALVTNTDGELAMVIGTMGGDTQPQILVQLLVRMLRNEQSPGRALAAARWGLAAGASSFDTWTERGRVRVVLEGHAPEGWADGLRRRGHEVTTVDAFAHSHGHAHAIRVLDDVLAGAADPRPRSGSASGF